MKYRDQAAISYLAKRYTRDYLVYGRPRRDSLRIKFVDEEASVSLKGLLYALEKIGSKVKSGAIDAAKSLIKQAIAKGTFVKDKIIAAIKRAVEAISYNLPGGKDRMVKAILIRPLQQFKALPERSVTDTYIRVKIARAVRDGIKQNVEWALSNMWTNAKDLLRRGLSGRVGDVIKRFLTKATVEIKEGLSELKRTGNIAGDKIKRILAAVKHFFTYDPKAIETARKMKELEAFMNAYSAFKNVAPAAQKALEAQPLVTPAP